MREELSCQIRTAGAIAVALSLAACGPKHPPSTYDPSVVPGTPEAKAVAILGRPSRTEKFALREIRADVLTYPFGQLLAQNGSVVAVIIATEPSYAGPYGIALGMTQEQVKAALNSNKKPRTGHKDSYDVVVGTNDTKTIDWYIDTDHLMIEMAAANANDPDAGYNVVSIALADAGGLKLLSAVTKAKVSGLYPGQQVFNYVSEPWKM